MSINENLGKLVQHARDKKPTDFKKTLTAELDNRIEAGIAEIRGNLSKNMFKGEKEIVENCEGHPDGVEHTHDDGTVHTHEGGDKPHTHDEEAVEEGKLPPALQKAIDAKKKNNSKSDDKDKSPPKDDDEEEDEDKDPVGEKFDIRDAAKKILNKEDSDKSEPGTQGDDAEYAKKRDAVLKKFGVKSCAALSTEEEKKACFKALDDAHVADHEE